MTQLKWFDYGLCYWRVLCPKFADFPDLFPNRGILRVPGFLPSVKFPDLGNISCFSLFFSRKRRKYRKRSSKRIDFAVDEVTVSVDEETGKSVYIDREN